MGKFNRDGDRGGYGGNRGGGSRFGDRDRRDVVMSDAVCAECHKNCQVPFKPSNDKPVYCKDCFSKRGGGPSRPSFGDSPRRDFTPRQQSAPSFVASKSDDGTKKLLETINVKLDSLIKAIENSSKPVVKATVKAPKAKVAVKKKSTKK